MLDRLQMLRNALLLEHADEPELKELAGLIKTVKLETAETWAIRGQPCAGMVMVEQGALEVILDSTPICSLSPGSVFCEDALVSDALAPATLRAASPSVIAVLERAAVEEQLDQMPQLWETLDQAWRRRVLVARLYAIDLFHDLSHEARLQLAQAFEEVDLAPGALLAEEGKVLDCFWVIREGQAELQLPEGEDPASVPLRAGEYVGELAVLEDFLQSATVSAPYGLRAMRLTRAKLSETLDLKAYAEVEAAAQRRKNSIL
ncbi:MAG TPA: cyclic nucleotide-binding domain-containing protein [Myxococcales bacterium]|nr:cyclic nucleotide-binding domain-containing protein [Myxococcales bacterium]